MGTNMQDIQFLSTLSLRRATAWMGGLSCDDGHFYPRSPCGERRPMDVPQYHILDISIHALLAESDIPSCLLIFALLTFLSTLSLRRATRAESDQQH